MKRALGLAFQGMVKSSPKQVHAKQKRQIQFWMCRLKTMRGDGKVQLNAVNELAELVAFAIIFFRERELGCD
jgi:hypothetical protein